MGGRGDGAQASQHSRRIRNVKPGVADPGFGYSFKTFPGAGPSRACLESSWCSSFSSSSSSSSSSGGNLAQLWLSVVVLRTHPGYFSVFASGAMANLPATNSREGVPDNDKSNEDSIEQPAKRRRIRRRLWCGCCCYDKPQMMIALDSGDFPFRCACTWCGRPDEEGRRRCRVRLALPVDGMCDGCRDGSSCWQVQDVGLTPS